MTKIKNFLLIFAAINAIKVLIHNHLEYYFPNS